VQGAALGRRDRAGGVALDAAQVAGVQREPPAGEQQARVAGDDLGREAVEPVEDGADAPALELGVPPAGDELGRVARVARGEQVADGLARLAGRLPPAGGPAMQCDHLAGAALARELVPQHVLEQVVVAKPLAAVVERDDEQVLALELLEHRP
jgi:hypothetical protein